MLYEWSRRRKGKKSAIERWQEKVRITSLYTCWIWCGARRGGNQLYDGLAKPEGTYGSIWMLGKPVYVHRWVYEVANFISLDSDTQVDHACRNRLCCNPLHLQTVTPAEHNARTFGQIPTDDWCDDVDEDWEF